MHTSELYNLIWIGTFLPLYIYSLLRNCFSVKYCCTSAPHPVGTHGLPLPGASDNYSEAPCVFSYCFCYRSSKIRIIIIFVVCKSPFVHDFISEAKLWQ